MVSALFVAVVMGAGALSALAQGDPSLNEKYNNKQAIFHQVPSQELINRIGAVIDYKCPSYDGGGAIELLLDGQPRIRFTAEGCEGSGGGGYRELELNSFNMIAVPVGGVLGYGKGIAAPDGSAIAISEYYFNWLEPEKGQPATEDSPAIPPETGEEFLARFNAEMLQALMHELAHTIYSEALEEDDCFQCLQGLQPPGQGVWLSAPCSEVYATSQASLRLCAEANSTVGSGADTAPKYEGDEKSELVREANDELGKCKVHLMECETKAGMASMTGSCDDECAGGFTLGCGALDPCEGECSCD